MVVATLGNVDMHEVIHLRGASVGKNVSAVYMGDNFIEDSRLLPSASTFQRFITIGVLLVWPELLFISPVRTLLACVCEKIYIFASKVPSLSSQRKDNQLLIVIIVHLCPACSLSESG